MNIEFPGSQIILDNKFNELVISKKIKSCLKEMHMIDMTPIQAKCIPHLLAGKDLLGAAKTGSGKTLAFLVPLVEKIMKDELIVEQGTVAIILSPTRELSLQTFKVLEELITDTSIRAGVVFGGNNKDKEAVYLRQGVTILVATPGRLLDHLNTTKSFNFNRLHTLVIDEADRLMEQGFLEEMRAIIRKLPSRRQTVLFSATLNITATKLKKKMKETDSNTKKKSIEDKVLTLACLSLKNDCVCIDMSMNDALNMITNKSQTSTVSQLSQNYILCDPEERFNMIYTLIRNNQKKKVMIFMATCNEVRFFYELLRNINSPVLALHGQQEQKKRVANFEKFKEEDHITLLCTDIAARGLDIPLVDLVVQFDPPDNHKEYIHRVGRTARAGKSGQAIIFLRTHEMGFLSMLRDEKIPVTALDLGRLLPSQDALETIVRSNGELRAIAEDAFRSVVSAYIKNRNTCFDEAQLDLKALGRNFGLTEHPQVVVKINKLTEKAPKRKAVTSSSKAPSKFPRNR